MVDYFVSCYKDTILMRFILGGDTYDARPAECGPRARHRTVHRIFREPSFQAGRAQALSNSRHQRNRYRQIT